MTNLFETKIKEAAHSIEPSVEFSDQLWSQITQLKKDSVVRKSPIRWMWIPASAMLTLVLVLTLVGPQNVIAAFRSLLAYLPGIGFVQNDASTLYLEEPVSVEQDGVTLKIEQVAADAERVIVSYHIDGLPTADSGATLCFYDDNKLLLPDGTTRLPIGGGVEDNMARVEFAPLPEGVTNATLFAAMNIPDPACTAPQEWNVKFNLGTTAPVSSLMPVIENTQSETEPGEIHNKNQGMALVIDRTAVLPEGYLIKGHMDWPESNWQSVNIDPASMYATDAEGKRVELQPDEDGNQDNEFGIKVVGKDFTAPLTLHVGNVFVWTTAENLGGFSFDAGSNPEIGQDWEINQEFEIAGQELVIRAVRVVEEVFDSIKTTGYAVEIESVKDFNGFLLCEGDHSNTQSWGQTRESDNNLKTLESYYPDGLPSGTVSCEFQDFQTQISGDWTVNWSSQSDTQ